MVRPAMTSLRAIIRPEIKNDDFHNALFFQARNASIETVLEIGASSGAGSTEALARGIAKNPAHPVLYTLECSRARFQKLAARYRRRTDVKPYNMSSVALADFPGEEEVRNFYHARKTGLNRVPEEKVIGWLRQDIAYLAEDRIPEGGIAHIKAENNIASFGLVLIDGSEFTGRAELELVYGAAIIALDDIMTFKNFDNHRRLLNDPAYEICAMNRYLRNVYSIFVRKEP